MFGAEILKCHLPEQFSPDWKQKGAGWKIGRRSPRFWFYGDNLVVCPFGHFSFFTSTMRVLIPETSTSCWDSKLIKLPWKTHRYRPAGFQRIPPSESSRLEPGKNTTTFFLAFYRVLIQGSVFTFECSSQLEHNRLQTFVRNLCEASAGNCELLQRTAPSAC